MSAADWDFAAQTPRIPAEIKPKRDMVVANGEKLTLGDTTIEFHHTPGHTPGTVSIIYPVKDGGTTHRVATWGCGENRPGSAHALQYRLPFQG
jgi:metallo-beta-lactamase class B